MLMCLFIRVPYPRVEGMGARKRHASDRNLSEFTLVYHYLCISSDLYRTSSIMSLLILLRTAYRVFRSEFVMHRTGFQILAVKYIASQRAEPSTVQFQRRDRIEYK